MCLTKIFIHKNYSKRNAFVKETDSTINLQISETSTQEATIYQYENYGLILTESEKQTLNEFIQTYPHKLFELANTDQMIDIEHSIDFALKTFCQPDS